MGPHVGSYYQECQPPINPGLFKWVPCSKLSSPGPNFLPIPSKVWSRCQVPHHPHHPHHPHQHPNNGGSRVFLTGVLTPSHSGMTIPLIQIYIFCVVTVCIIHRLTMVHNWIDKHLPAGGAPLLICLVAKMLPIRHSDPQGPQSRDRPGKLTNTGDINNKNCFRQDKTEVWTDKNTKKFLPLGPLGTSIATPIGSKMVQAPLDPENPTVWPRHPLGHPTQWSIQGLGGIRSDQSDQFHKDGAKTKQQTRKDS